MAFETGTATNAQDFYDRLLNFLTTNPALVASNEAWEIVWQAPTQPDAQQRRVLRGRGLNGGDFIYVGIGLNQDPIADEFEIVLNGMTGVNGSSENLSGHVNTSQTHIMFLDSNPMTYWFIASGRRFMAVARISTVYECMYAGYFLPYGTPLSYPYPLFIGGSNSPRSPRGSGQATSWRSTDDGHSAFFRPNSNTSTASNGRHPSANVIDPTGTWREVTTLGNVVDCGLGPQRSGNADNWSARINFGRNTNTITNLSRLGRAFGGNYPLIPMTITHFEPVSQTYGILDGVFYTSGIGNAAENIISHNGVDHLVVQNTFRTTTGSYAAFALE